MNHSDQNPYELHLQVNDYYDSFDSITLIRRITEEQKKYALNYIGQKILNRKTRFNNSEIKIEANYVSFVHKSKKYKYQFYVTTRTARSPYPWYGISKKHLENLKREDICGVICIFFDEYDSNGYQVYYKEWKFDELCNQNQNQKIWNYSKDEDTYRWNPQNKYKSENDVNKMNKLGKCVR